MLPKPIIHFRTSRWLHVSPRLTLVECFPVLGTTRLTVLPFEGFPALGTDYTRFPAPDESQVTCFPALGTGYMFS